MRDLLGKINLHKQILLKSILEEFKSQGLQPKIGIELEFYLSHKNLPASEDLVTQFIIDLKSQIKKHNIFLQGIVPEQGAGQIEIQTLPCLDIENLGNQINQIKDIAYNLNPDLQINFSSQPYKNDCGNSLQINFSLMKDKQYLFAKDNDEDSEYMLWSIASALQFTKNMMIIFAPDEEDYLRFDIELNRNLHKKQKYTAPVNISWGYDNRSALIRIPRTNKDFERRLEFRLGSGSSDVDLVCIFFLLAILEGIKQKEKPRGSAIYGNAFDEQYDLELLPNYTDAENYFLNNNPLINKILSILIQNKLD